MRAGAYYAWAPGTTWVYEASFLGGKPEVRTVVLGAKRDGFATDDAGGKFMYDGEGLRDERRYLLREPIAPGKRWESVSAVGATEIYEITRAHKPCEARAGKWDDCVEVRSSIAAADNASLENVMTFARGVGLVRVATTLNKGTDRIPQVQMELIAFRKR